MPSRVRLRTLPIGAAMLIAVLFGLALSGNIAPAAEAAGGYHQTNLIADTSGQAAVTDANLINPWGLVAGPATPWWVSDNHSGFSTVYNGSGQPVPAGAPLIVAVAPPGGSPTGTVAAPTGIVFNGTTDFKVDGTNTAKFIFSTEDGTISGWASGATSVLKADNSSSDAIYKGLAIGSNSSGNLLFATDFHNGKIDTFDANYTAVTTLTGTFADPNLPAGFAPFNIQNIGGQLYVTYAKQDADAEDDSSGAGNGYVDVFDMNGTLVKRLISQGALNSPWGIVMAPAGFGELSGDLLVGNFGDGAINAYNPSTGALISALKDESGTAVSIPGLWALAFGNGGSAGSATTLYFSAGPGEEGHGLFGSLTFAAAATTAPTATPVGLPNTGGVPTDGSSDLSLALLAIVGAILVLASASVVAGLRRNR